MNNHLKRRDFLKVSGVGFAGVMGASFLAGCTPAASGGKQETPDESIKVKVAFFSPTGGTRNAVGTLAESITEKPKYIDLTSLADRQDVVEFAKDELAIIAAPSMGGRLATVDGMLANLKGDNTPTVILASFGNRNYDDLLAQMKGILTGQGFSIIGGIAVVTPHVFSEKAGRNRPNAEDRAVITDFAEKVTAKLKSGENTEATIPGNPNPEIKPLKVATKSYNAEKCTQCKLCASNCPVGAINQDDVSLLNEELCISCQRCTYSCDFYGRSYDPSPVREFIENNCLKKKTVEMFV